MKKQICTIVLNALVEHMRSARMRDVCTVGSSPLQTGSGDLGPHKTGRSMDFVALQTNPCQSWHEPELIEILTLKHSLGAGRRGRRGQRAE